MLLILDQLLRSINYTFGNTTPSPTLPSPFQAPKAEGKRAKNRVDSKAAKSVYTGKNTNGMVFEA